MQSASPATPADKTIGGRYVVEHTLGKGGIGVVYAVFDQGTQQRAALKRLLSDDPRSKELFEHEYRTLAALRHPGIVEAYDYGIDEQGPYYTMELLKGRDLSDAAPRPWSEVCACLRDVAAIIGMLHARRLVHRDLSPRNLWRTLDGHIKLLDFGTLAPFGVECPAIGTPPLMAPEVLDSKPLDQRADLYALGAIGYWMLTSAHAYRAGSLGELPRLWQQQPPRPSELVKLMGADLSAIPEELDALILALLSQDRDARPASGFDVIDRLQAIANLPPDEAHVRTATAYLQSKAFVGRGDVVQRFTRRLKRARRGKPQALWIEGEEGVGRSRLLEELSMVGRLRGTLVIDASGSDSRGGYSAAATLVVKLFQACPALAGRVAARHASTLCQISPEIRELLSRVGLATGVVAGAKDRAEKQLALRELFCGVAREKPLLLAADDIGQMDEESQALIAALPFVSDGERLMVVASCQQSGSEDSTGGSLAALRRGAAVSALPALTQEEMRELLQSIFGDTPNLDRITARLHALSAGNPQHSLLLVEHLIRTGAARYADGSWDLPKDVPQQGLPTSLHASVLSRLDRLDAPTRELARWISVVEQEYIPRALVGALVHGRGGEAQGNVAQLVSARVLAGTGESLRFTHAVLRENLRREVGETERCEVDVKLAKWFEQDTSDPVIQSLRAALHWFRAGELDRAHERMHRILDATDMTAGEALRDAAPLVAELVDGLGAAGRNDTSMVHGLGVLCTAGYFVAPEYADRYGERGMAALQHLVPTGLVRKLRPFVGAKLALMALLIVASIRLKRTPFAPSFPKAVQLLASSAAALTGFEATRTQPAQAHTYTDAIEPLTALGKRHIVTAVYRMSRQLAHGAEDRAADAFRSMEEVIEWLKDDEPFEGAGPEGASPYLPPMWFIWGFRGTFLDDDTPLRAAELLERVGPVYQLNAYQLRAMYHTSRGEWDQAELYRKRLGVQAIQMGMSWRADVIAGLITLPAVWARDAVALRRATDQLERLAGEMPSYRFHERAARAAYHVVRGTPEEAIALLEGAATKPLAQGGWTRTRSILAAAYNAVGQHQAALDVCEHALSHLTPEDLEFVGLNLGVQVERVLALGGLGREQEATSALDAMLERYAERGPLVRAYLHEAAAQLALRYQDFARCRHHLERGELLARQTNSSGQLLHFKDLDYQRRLAEAPFDPAGEQGPLRRDDEHLALRVQLMLRTALGDPSRVPAKLTSIAAEITGASAGIFVLPDTTTDAGVVAVQGPTPDSRVLNWVRERMHMDEDDDEETTATSDGPQQDPNQLQVDDVHYCLKTFWTVQGGKPRAAGALVLGFAAGAPTLPRDDVLLVMADSLTVAAQRSVASSSPLASHDIEIDSA